MLFDHNWALCILLFCALHLLASSLSIPGACTALNFIAGATFGFGLACAIVYPVTVLSGVLVYLVGRRFSSQPVAARYQNLMARISTHLGKGNFLFFVSLRLSPFLPFGPLNLLCGWLRVPFGLFVTSTTVGIFFDVTLLTSLGAAVRLGVAAPSGEDAAHGRVWLFVSFAALLVIFWVVRSLLFKEKDQIRL